MSYVRHFWQTGDIVTASQMNEIEEGIVEAIENSEGSISVVTPLDFGAKGDGTTDDTAAFQAALNAPGIHDVFVPTSNGEKYIITDTLTIPAKCRRIYGEGLPRGTPTYGTVWFIPNAATTPEQRDQPLFSIGNTEAFGFYGLHFHCAPPSGTNRVGTFLDATSTYCDKDIHVLNTSITNFYTQFNFRGRGLTVLNCTLASASTVAILNWDDENDSQRSSHPASMGQRAIRFQNNRIHSIQTDFWIIQTGHAYGMVIEGNVIDHGQGKIIRAYDEAWNWNISGNLFQCIDGYTSSSLTMNAMVAFNKGAKNCIIDSNVFSADPTYWQNGKVPDGWITVTDGYSMRSCTITGNTFKDYGLRGIWLTNADGTTITGNTFETSMESAIAAFVIRGPQVNTVITGNTLTSGSKGVFMLPDETATFTNCEIGHNAYDNATLDNEYGILVQEKAPSVDKNIINNNPIIINDGANNLPTKQFLVNIIPAQAGEGDPSPTNIRALSGWTGATLTINGEDIGITFPEEARTVYHGTLNVLTGVLTVDYAIDTLDNNTKDVKIDVGNYTQFYFPLGSYARKLGGSTVYCTHYKTVYPTTSSTWKTQDDVVTYSNSALSGINGRCVIIDTTYSSVADLKAFWEAQKNNGTPVQIAYPLATPQTYQLTPQVVKTLLGTNSFSVDCGTLDLTYVVDTKAYADNVTDEKIDDTNVVFDTRINCAHGLINYGYDTRVNKDISLLTGGHIDRDSTIVTINGSSEANSASIKFIVSYSNIGSFVGSSPVPTGDGVHLVDGHIYRIRIHHLSGTATNSVTAIAYKAKSVTAIGTGETDVNTGDSLRTFTYSAEDYPDGIYVCLLVSRTTTGTVLTNYALNVTLEDLTIASIPTTTAPTFDETTTYEIGDYVGYNSTLYRFIINHDAGAWNESEVVAVTVGDELKNLSAENINLNAKIDSAYVQTQISGTAPLTFSDGAAANASKAVVGRTPMQAGSGTPSPSNVRVFRYLTGVEIRATGNNLWGGEDLVRDVKRYLPNAIINADDKTVSFLASDTVNGGSLARGMFKSQTRYTIIFTQKKSSSTGLNMRVYYTDGTYDNLTGGTTTKSTIVFVTDSGKTVSYISKYNSGGRTYLYYDECGIFEGVLTAVQFEPYFGHYVKVDWSMDNVWSGSFDFASGTLTSDYGHIASYNGETITEPWMSSIDEYAAGTTPSIGAEVVYPLTTPVVHQLDPAPFKTLHGLNNVFGYFWYYLPTYDTEVPNTTDSYDLAYSTDPTIINNNILTMIAPNEITSVASQAYTIGKAFIYTNKLYKVTSNISVGDTIIPGTNCIQTTLTELIGI